MAEKNEDTQIEDALFEGMRKAGPHGLYRALAVVEAVRLEPLRRSLEIQRKMAALVNLEAAAKGWVRATGSDLYDPLPPDPVDGHGRRLSPPALHRQWVHPKSVELRGQNMPRWIRAVFCGRTDAEVVLWVQHGCPTPSEVNAGGELAQLFLVCAGQDDVVEVLPGKAPDLLKSE